MNNIISGSIEKYPEEIGRRIRMSRKSLGYTISQAAELMDVSDVYLGKVERNKIKPSFNLLIKICSCYAVSSDYLIYGKEKTSLEEKYMNSLLNLNDEQQTTLIKIAAIIRKENISGCHLELLLSAAKSISDYISEARRK